MKKRRNFLIIREGKERERAININDISYLSKVEGGTKIYTCDGTNFEIEESIEEILSVINGRKGKRDEKTT